MHTPPPNTRRTLLAAVLAMGLAPAFAQGSAARTAMEVWKDPNCGCCQDWITHLEGSGFAVQVHEAGNDAARQRLGVERRFGSCHTGLVGGYAIEGHVPAPEIRRLLATVNVYKVGHHGSRNATPKTLWNGFKNRSTKKTDKRRLKSIMSTMKDKHGKATSNTEVPRKTLVTALEHESELFNTQNIKGKGNISLVCEFKF